MVESYVAHNYDPKVWPWAPSNMKRFLQELPHNFAWYQGKVLTGVNFKRDSEGWLAVIKCEDSGQPLVAFTGARYWEDLIEVLAYEIQMGLLTWRPDRYAKKRNPNP